MGKRMETFKVKVNGKEIEVPVSEMFSTFASERAKYVLKEFCKKDTEHAKPARDVK